ncbi:Dual specificity protein phosphatase PPS1 [Nakaseomyces bracarensis]|uniref:Dual specificity protein phosphatase PPS1 n=1 Tax=Nakaseomyces bracarensis TaxID=273131 RepID=A0ABR4P121_9SACH
MSISAGEAYGLLDWHLEKNRLPGCGEMFPWAHEFYVTSRSPSYPGSVCLLRSKVTRNRVIDNIAMLRGSMDLRDVFIAWPNVTDMSAGDESLESELLALGIGLTAPMVSLCKGNGVLPFLKTDATAYSKFHLKRMRNRVMNRLHSASLPSNSSGAGAGAGAAGGSRHNEANINPLRRFDLQCAKMVEIAEHVLVYCLHFENGKNHLQCNTCLMYTQIIKIALYHHTDNIHLEDGIVSDRNYDQKIQYIAFENFNELPKPLLVVPLHHIGEVVRSENETRQHQLVSSYDLLKFNSWDSDLKYHENFELSTFTSASSIAGAIWVGNSLDNVNYRKQFALKQMNGVRSLSHPPADIPSIHRTTVTIENVDYEINSSSNINRLYRLPDVNNQWILFLKCNEASALPSFEKLESTLVSILDFQTSGRPFALTESHILEFPSSGTIALGQLNITSVEILLNTCYLMYQVYKTTNYNTLLYCTDGYTETSILLISYLIFLWDLPIEDVLFKVHKEYGRPFFLFHVDLQILGHLQSLLREFSPARGTNACKYEESIKRYRVTQEKKELLRLTITSEMFSSIFLFKLPSSSNFTNLKGPLPSQILDHLYLGSLEHAERPELLRSLGITHILSVGEKLSWVFKDGKVTTCETKAKVVEKDGFKVCWIQNLEDNGMDPIMAQLNNSLEFIDSCYKKKGKILVHCMVGVSRSATVCIAECMKRLNVDVMRAYLYVRVRRLNIIIQPHLMFMYELEKWAESTNNTLLSQGKNRTDWHLLCREISRVNSRYD